MSDQEARRKTHMTFEDMTVVMEATLLAAAQKVKFREGYARARNGQANDADILYATLYLLSPLMRDSIALYSGKHLGTDEFEAKRVGIELAAKDAGVTVQEYLAGSIVRDSGLMIELGMMAEIAEAAGGNVLVSSTPQPPAETTPNETTTKEEEVQ